MVTTAEPSALSAAGDWRAQAREVVSWASSKFFPCSLGLFTTVDDARAFPTSPDKLSALRKINEHGRLLAEPAPAALTRLL